MGVFYVICVLLLLYVTYAVIEHLRMKRLSNERGEPNICEYAKSFDYRNVDTRIMREVWNEVQRYIGKYNGKPFPVKADDIFEETYHFDLDDIDEIYWTVADRLEIDTECSDDNPYHGQVTSVRHLVLFLDYQKNNSVTKST